VPESSLKLLSLLGTSAECGARQGLAIRAMANHHFAGVDLGRVSDLAAVATTIDLHGVNPSTRPSGTFRASAGFLAQ
jgi:hypothetical protein